MLTMHGKDINRINISPLKSALYARNHTIASLPAPPPPLSPNKSKSYTNLVLYSALTPCPITTSRISKLPQVRFLIVWSTVNCFAVHQPAATHSMHLQSIPTRTFTAPPIGGTFGVQSNICGGTVLSKQSTC